MLLVPFQIPQAPSMFHRCDSVTVTEDLEVSCFVWGDTPRCDEDNGVIGGDRDGDRRPRCRWRGLDGLDEECIEGVAGVK